jgi:apolipoprotein N-acyltransferase
MISEFFHFDANVIIGWITYKHLALIPFFLGVFCLLFYYLIWQPKHPDELETM